MDGADVPGAAADATVANLADRVDGLLAVVASLAGPEADIVDATRPGLRPGHRRARIARGRQVWAVGHSTRT